MELTTIQDTSKIASYQSPFRLYEIEDFKGTHLYKRPEEPETHFRPGITTILDCFTSPGLKAWYVKSTPEEIKRAQDKGAKKGTEFHQLRETKDSGYEIQVPEHLKAHEEGYAILAEKYQLKPVAQEIPLGSDFFGYGGKADLICELTKDDKTSLFLLDYKTNKRTSESWGCQVAAYKYALDEMVGTNLNVGVMWLPDKPWDNWKKPKIIFYNDPMFWFEGAMGCFHRWKMAMDTYQQLKKAKWNWLDHRPIKINKENT